MTALDRARLEVDRTLRGRAFFGRALAGCLEEPEYADLVVQLGGLASIAASSLSVELEACAHRDLERLDTCSLARECPTLRLMQEACSCWDGVLEPRERLAATVGILGTSWTLDATERLSLRYPGATHLLEYLGVRGLLSVRRLRLFRREDRHEVVAAAGLMRGALLGLADYLDTTWPAPLGLVRA